jgi:hypothetical protein
MCYRIISAIWNLCMNWKQFAASSCRPNAMAKISRFFCSVCGSEQCAAVLEQFYQLPISCTCLPKARSPIPPWLSIDGNTTTDPRTLPGPRSEHTAWIRCCISRVRGPRFERHHTTISRSTRSIDGASNRCAIGQAPWLRRRDLGIAVAVVSRCNKAKMWHDDWLRPAARLSSVRGALTHL